MWLVGGICHQCGGSSNSAALLVIEAVGGEVSRARSSREGGIHSVASPLSSMGPAR